MSSSPLAMASPSPGIVVSLPFDHTSRPSPPRRSSSMHKQLITKLRPLPFQYVWSVWYSKSGAVTAPPATSTSNTTSTLSSASGSTYTTHLTLLSSSVPDIGTFYRIYNNFPWTQMKLKDSVFVFRAGVQPLWEDPENLNGGCWVIKVRREDDRAVKLWEEICLLGCGGELQAAIATERDHVLGMCYSPRLYWAHISIWTKKGDNIRSIDILERTVLDRLSPELRPRSGSEYYYKKHSDHEGWKDAVGTTKVEAVAATSIAT